MSCSAMRRRGRNIARGGYAPHRTVRALRPPQGRGGREECCSHRGRDLPHASPPLPRGSGSGPSCEGIESRSGRSSRGCSRRRQHGTRRPRHRFAHRRSRRHRCCPSRRQWRRSRSSARARSLISCPSSCCSSGPVVIALLADQRAQLAVGHEEDRVPPHAHLAQRAGILEEGKLRADLLPARALARPVSRS